MRGGPLLWSWPAGGASVPPDVCACVQAEHACVGWREAAASWWTCGKVIRIAPTKNMVITEAALLRTCLQVSNRQSSERQRWKKKHVYLRAGSKKRNMVAAGAGARGGEGVRGGTRATRQSLVMVSASKVRRVQEDNAERLDVGAGGCVSRTWCNTTSVYERTSD